MCSGVDSATGRADMYGGDRSCANYSRRGAAGAVAAFQAALRLFLKRGRSHPCALWHLQLHKLLVHLPCPPEAHSTEFAATIEACDAGDSSSKTTPRFLKNLPTNL